MTKPKARKKKKMSYETRVRKQKLIRANRSDEQRQKMKDYNRERTLKIRANETPLDREMRLQKSRESAKRRRIKRKALAERELRKQGILPPKKAKGGPAPAPVAPPPAPPTTSSPLLLGAIRNVTASNSKNAILQPVVKGRRRPEASKLTLPFINYKPSFPMHMGMAMPSAGGPSEYYQDMATVCPIECNVDISPEPRLASRRPPAKSVNNNDEMIVKNIGAHVVIKKKVSAVHPGEEVRLPDKGGASDWNGTASVCPIECNVDITDPADLAPHHPPPKRSSILDTLKQMGTHVTIKRKSVVNNRSQGFLLNSNNPPRLSLNSSVEIKPVESRLKNSEITLMKRNGNSVSKFGSQLLVQKVRKVGVDSPREVAPRQASAVPEDFDLPCPIECNVVISESS